MYLSRRTILAVGLVFVAALGCERTPEDVEKWRNAQRGMEKMQEWATSSSEPMDVRVRSIQIMVEQNNPTLVDTTLKEIEDEETRSKLAGRAAETVLELWEKGEPPTLDEETKDKGGRVKIQSGSPAIVAKDAAYYLIPHTEGETQQKLREILVEWLSSSWRVRNEAGKTNLGQLLPRAGDEGIERSLRWLEETDDFYKVTSLLRKHAGDNTRAKIADIVRTKAEDQHPDLPDGLLAAVVNTEHESILPYLKRAITDPKSSPEMVDQCMEALKRIQGPKSTQFFSKVIRTQPGNLRWAAVNDLIKIRGKAGILTAAKSLPLDKEEYEKEAEQGKSFAENAGWFASFTVGEMISSDVSSIAGVLIRSLESDGWPVRVLGLMTTSRAVTCATKPKECGEGKQARSETQDLIGDDWSELQGAVSKLTSSRETIPAWNETKTIGDLAGDILEAMKSAERN